MGLPQFDATRFPVSWRPHAQAWGDQLAAAGTAPSTLNGYGLHLRWLAEHSERGPWELDPDELSDWLDGNNWATVTRRKVLNSLRSFYTWALSDGRVQRSPLAGIAAAPPRKTGPRALPIAGAWAQPVREWRTWLDARALSAATQRTYLHHVRALSELHADPWAVTAADLARFLSRADLAPETKKSGRVALRGFYAWASTVGHITTDPAAELPTVRVPRTVPRPAPDAALQEALAGADDRTELVLLLASYAGLRISEIARLHTRDVDTEVLRVTGKGGHQRLIPLHPHLAAALRLDRQRRATGLVGSGWSERTPPQLDGWLFPARDPDQHLTAGTIGKLIDGALPRGWTPHTLRHRFATLAYAGERDLRAVQELLGHASPNTTVRYAAVPSTSLRTAVTSIPVLYPSR